MIDDRNIYALRWNRSTYISSQFPLFVSHKEGIIVLYEAMNLFVD